MCFLKDSKEEAAVKAWDDIYAVKVLKREKDGTLKSPYRKNYKWTLGKMKTAAKFDSKTSGMCNVNIGLHCYKNINSAIRFTRRHTDKRAFLVKIPVGAMYYENATEICANKMIIVQEIKKPKK